MEANEVKTDALVPSERLRDKETGQFLAKPSEVYIESRQRHKELITKQLQDVLQSPACDLEPLDSDPAYVALLKAQILNGLTATGKNAGPAVKLLDTLHKTCGMQELPPAEVNHGVKIVLINFPENMMDKTARPYEENRTLVTPQWAEATEVYTNRASANPSTPKVETKPLTPEEQRKAKCPWTEL